MNNLILSSTPLRISLIGGGTDFKEFYANTGTYGQVISLAINLNTYCIIKKKNKALINSGESFFKNEISNTNIYVAFTKFLKEQKIDQQYDIVFYSDIPSGSGLGTSSSFILSLLKCFFISIKKKVSLEQLINYSNYFESHLMRRPIGMQDAWGSQIPGIKKIKFTSRKIFVKKINNNKFTNFVNSKLFLFPINAFKSNKELLGNIRKNIVQNRDIVHLLKKMNQLSNNAYEAILNNNYKYLLSILKESHKIKSSYAEGVSNNAIKKSFDYLEKNGLTPLKVLGAGGRGFILFFSNDKKKIIKKKINYLDFKVV